MAPSSALLAERLLPALLALALASVHLLARSELFLTRLSRGRFLSFAGGVSVAYVFVHVLPEIDDYREPMGQHALLGLPTEKEVYLVTMLGFVVYYGLERLARQSADESLDDKPSPGIFRIHVGAYAAYNAVVGYLLFHQEAPGVSNLLLFSLALGLHFLLNDVSLEDQHEAAYHRVGRWALAGSVLVGAAVGALTELDRVTLGLLFAFLSGGIVLSVVREELPAEREGKFWAFTAGVAVYTAVLLLT
ncbi:ZIP family transporter [Halosimplex sp. J119]